MTLPQILALVIFLTVSGLFSWSIQNFFTAPEGKAARMKWLMAVGGLGSLAQLAVLLFRFQLNAPFFGLGLACYLASAGLFFWAIRTNQKRPLTLAYTRDKPEHIVTAGPYAKIRHPFYASYTLFWLAGAAITANPFLLFNALVMFPFYYGAAKQEEEKFQASELSADYASYRAKTGMFFPKIFQ